MVVQQTPAPGSEGVVERDEVGLRCTFASQTPGFKKKSESALMAQTTAHCHIVWV